MNGIEVTETFSGFTAARSGLRRDCALAGGPRNMARPRSELAAFDEIVKMPVILSSTCGAHCCQARTTSGVSCHLHLKRTIETLPIGCRRNVNSVAMPKF